MKNVVKLLVIAMGGAAISLWFGGIDLNNKFENIHFGQMNIANFLIPTIKGLLNNRSKLAASNDLNEIDVELRDPFLPSNINSGSNKRTSKRLLEGLVYRDDKEYALISGKMVALGDWVRNMRVIMIRNDKVVLANNKNIRVLYLF